MSVALLLLALAGTILGLALAMSRAIHAHDPRKQRLEQFADRDAAQGAGVSFHSGSDI